uniref:Uncharacterized protein n=1 Tax=Anguilla anguilla TaxID=7936 RepID=A0A0E9SYM1_ANGAN
MYTRPQGSYAQYSIPSVLVVSRTGPLHYWYNGCAFVISEVFLFYSRCLTCKCKPTLCSTALGELSAKAFLVNKSDGLLQIGLLACSS